MRFFRKRKTPLKREDAIIVSEKSFSTAIEGYNRLKDNVLFAFDNGRYKVLQISSSIQSEGKTTVTCNLGVSLGFNQKKVVILDLDFRKAKVYQLFSGHNDVGIAEYMKDEASLDEIIQHTEFENVDIISRGEKIYNSSLVLASTKFKNMIEDLKDRYDFVVFDTAPVLQISDYIHTSKLADGTLFLVAFGSTGRGQVKEAVKELRKNDVNIIGTVFTYYNKKEKSDYGYYYYYSYRDTEDERENKIKEKHRKRKN